MTGVQTCALPISKVDVRNATANNFGDYIASNAEIVKAQAGKSEQKNSRKIMPQTNNTAYDQTISTGSINIRPDPVQFTATQNASTFHPGLNLHEQMLVLSGVLTVEQAEKKNKKKSK